MSELAFCGDLFLNQTVSVDLALPEHYVVNLEAPLTQAEQGYPGKVNLRGSQAAFDASLPYPPTAVCLANNHVMDFCEAGFTDTLSFLEKRGVPYFGAGLLEDNCDNPLVVPVAGVKVGMMGYVCPTASPVFAAGERPGCMPISLEKVAQDIGLAKEQGAERIVVQLHWGAERVGLPRPEDVQTARAIIDLGADLLVGHHAHCIQAFERYKDASIFYGVGNWIFPAHASPSYYTEAGEVRKIHVSESHERNKRSLVVVYNLESEEVTVQPSYFDGQRVYKGRFSPNRYQTTISLSDGYEARFTRAFKWGKFRNIVENFLASPKLPRLEHVKNISKLVRTGQYE